MTAYRDRFEHHLIVKMAGDGIEEARAWLKTAFPSAAGDFFECTLDRCNCSNLGVGRTAKLTHWA